MIHEAIYSTLLRRDRRRYHARTATVIEESGYWSPDEKVELLAHHYGESATPSKAIPLLLAAAEYADRRCANEAAIHHYRRAEELIEKEPEHYQHDALRVKVGLGRALRFTGDLIPAGHMLSEALALFQGQDSAEMTSQQIRLWATTLRELADVRAREGDYVEAFSHLSGALQVLGPAAAHLHTGTWRALMDRMAWVRFRQGRLEEASDLAKAATGDLGPGLEEEPTIIASLHNTLGGICWQQGDLSQAVTHVEQSLALYEGLGYVWGMANALNNLGILHFRLGQWAKTLEDWERTLTLRQAIGDIQNEAVVRNNLGILRMSMGHHHLARQELEQGLAIGRDVGDGWIIAQAQVSLAQLAATHGDFQSATTSARSALSLSDAVGSAEVRVQAWWILALAQANLVDLASGLASAEQALTLAREGGLLDLQADCLRVLGILVGQAQNWSEAESHFQASIALCSQLNDPYRQGLALLELGRLYHQRGDREPTTQEQWYGRAREGLTHAARLFGRLGAAHDLEQVTAVQRQLIEAGRPVPKTAPARAASPELPEGEWRTAAIIWLHISPVPDADDEVVFETSAQIVPAVTTIARENQGEVMRRRDGLTIVFGAPVAFEDDVERAVQTAWQISDLLEHANDHGALIVFRIAVSHGDLVAGRLRTQLHEETIVQGEPVEDAQRLAEAGPPGQVWVTDTVKALASRLFEFESTAPTAAHLLPTRAFSRLVGYREDPAPARGLPGMRARFVGRATSLEKMAELAMGIRQGVGGLIWVEGEPGIGKSRLMHEFTDQFAAEGVWQWSGRCSPQRVNTPFALFVDMLADAFGTQPSDTSDQIAARIEQGLASWPRDAQMTRPYIEMLMGLQPSGRDGERLARLDPEQLRQQTFVALRRLVKSLALRQPLLLVLDDLHWIDAVSAELLLFMLTMVATVPILFVCAQRREGADSPNDRLVRVQSLIPTQTIRFSLERLSEAEAGVLLDDLLSQGELPETLRESLLRRSEGNPYFIEEFVRMLIEQRWIRRREDQWEVYPGRDLGNLALPATLETLIRSRVDALPGELRQLVQCAAVIGSPFEIGLLQTLCDSGSARSYLERLQARLIVTPRAEQDIWEFSHSLIETVVYGSMLRVQRKAYHQRAAEGLERRWSLGEMDQAERLAYHFSQAGDSARALGYLVLAGERAAAKNANEAALNYFEQATQLLSGEVDNELSCRVAAGLGDVYRAMGRYNDSIGVLEHGLAVARTADLPLLVHASLYRRLGETTQKQGELETSEAHLNRALATLGSPANLQGREEAARILVGLGWTYFIQGSLDRAEQVCRVGRGHAQESGALNEVSSAENLLGGIFYRQGEWAHAARHTRRAMELREQMDYSWGVASSLNNLAILEVAAGNWEQARSFFERSLALRQEMGDVEGVAIGHRNLGTLNRDRGNLERAEIHFRESLAVAAPFKMGFHIGNATMELAQVLLLRGDVDAASSVITTGVEQAEALGAKDLQAEVSRVRAEIVMIKGDGDLAIELAERSVSLASETGNRLLETTAWRVMSEIECRRGKSDRALQAIDQALAGLADVTDELEIGRVKAQAGRVYLEHGDHDRAHGELAVALETFERLDAKLDVERVQNLMLRLV